jgi:hypothetical protein
MCVFKNIKIIVYKDELICNWIEVGASPHKR